MKPTIPKKTKQSLLSRMNFALSGIVGTYRSEVSFKIQSFCFILLLVFIAIERPPLLWCAVFLICASIVLALELVNTAIESTLDVLHPSYSSKIGFAKDCLAGAVLVASLASLAVFVLYLLSK